MSLFKNIMTAVRGHSNNVGEAIVDANANTILTQQVKDVATEIKQSKIKIAELDGKRKTFEKTVVALQNKKAAAKGVAKAHIEAGDEAKAIAVLDAIDLEITPQLAPKEAQLKMTVDSLVKLRAALAIAQKNKVEFETRVEITKTQMQVNKMTEEANASTLTSASASSQMKATLERFEAKNEQRSNTLESLNEMENSASGLDSLLAESGTANKSAADRLADL